MSSGCVTGVPKRKPNAPLKFYMDNGVLCTAFGTNNALCKFGDFVFTFLRDAYGAAVRGFVIDALVKVVTDNPRVAGYYDTPAGKFDLSIATKAKKLLNLIQTAQDVQEALDSLKLGEFDTDEFCESNPLLTPVAISYSMIVAALIPFGNGFDILLEAVTKNWIIIKFGDYCTCVPVPKPPFSLPPPPPTYNQYSNQSCFGDAAAQARLFDSLTAIDEANRVFTAKLADLAVVPGFWLSDFPFPDMAGLYMQYLAENNLDITEVAFLGGFPAYYRAANGEGYQHWLNNPDDLFPGIDPNEPESGYGVLVGREFRLTYYPTPTPNPPGVTNQIFAPGQEPPCNCVLIVSWEKLQERSVVKAVQVDGALNIRRIVDEPLQDFQPPLSFLDTVVPRLGVNAYAYPRFVLTNQSCPSYIVITDDDLLCQDFPALCSCKEVLIPTTVPVRTGCDIGDQEDIEIFYKDYEGASCITKIIEVDVFKKCDEDLETIELIVNAMPPVLT